MSLVTRFPNGVSNTALEDGIGGLLPFLDPTKHIVFWDDFHRYTAGDWTITTTEAGAGSATEALTDGHGGLLLITNDSADNDNDFFQNVGEAFRFTSGKKAYFEARFKVSDATQSDVVVGLQIKDTSPLDVTDGVFFLKADGATTFNFFVEKNDTQSTSSAVATLADNTFIKLGFYYDGAATFTPYVNGVAKTPITSTANMPDDEDLTVSFGIQNGEAVAKTMTVDYILAAMDR